MPLEEAAARATEAPQMQPCLRNVQDHLLLVNQEVAAQRDLLGRVLQASMAVISVEQTKIRTTVNSEAVVKASSGNIRATDPGSNRI